MTAGCRRAVCPAPTKRQGLEPCPQGSRRTRRPSVSRAAESPARVSGDACMQNQGYEGTLERRTQARSADVVSNVETNVTNNVETNVIRGVLGITYGWAGS